MNTIPAKMFLLTTTSSTTGSGMNMFVMIAIYAAFFAVLYLVFFRPQNKKRKKEAEMRQSAQVGDEITTIGGICGRIVAVKDESESVIIETGSDKAKLRVKRWAIGSVDNAQEEPKEKEKKDKEKKS